MTVNMTNSLARDSCQGGNVTCRTMQCVGGARVLGRPSSLLTQIKQSLIPILSFRLSITLSKQNDKSR